MKLKEIVRFRMRDIKLSYNHIQNIRARAQTIIKELNKKGVLNEEMKREISSAKSLDELDHLVIYLV